MNYKDKILIQKMSNSEEDLKKSIMTLIISLIISNVFALLAVLYCFFEFDGLNIIFVMSAVTSIIISVITVKMTELYDNVGRMHNKIIIECVSNEELSENNEIKQD